MKIETLCDMRIDRQHVESGSKLDVDASLGRRLVGIGRARSLEPKKGPKPQRETTEKAAPETAAKG